MCCRDFGVVACLHIAPAGTLSIQPPPCTPSVSGNMDLIVEVGQNAWRMGSDVLTGSEKCGTFHGVQLYFQDFRQVAG